MLYRTDRYGNQLSELGFGCMRWTKSGGSVDLEKAEKEVLRAAELGVNYFDTAYIYPGNEAALGAILARNPGLRDRINIATKLPHYLMKSRNQMERTFQEELSRLGTDHIDYYLMHMVTDLGAWERVCALGIEDWIKEKKTSGQIRQIGFSFHGPTDEFCRVLNAYDWDFCQIQYNYMDEHSQAGRRGLETAETKGIPVIIMEPLRGGRLVNLLPERAKQILADSPHGWSPAEWGLRWLYGQSGVTVVLSGMNSLEMVEENCRIASEAAVGTFGPAEQAVLDQVKEEIGKALKVPCTGCSYCMPCPSRRRYPRRLPLLERNLHRIQKKRPHRLLPRLHPPTQTHQRLPLRRLRPLRTALPAVHPHPRHAPRALLLTSRPRGTKSPAPA